MAIDTGISFKSYTDIKKQKWQWDIIQKTEYVCIPTYTRIKSRACMHPYLHTNQKQSMYASLHTHE